MTHQPSERARLALDHLSIPPQPRTPPVGLIRKDQRALPNARGTADDNRARHGRLAAVRVRQSAGTARGGRARDAVAEGHRARSADAHCIMDRGRLEDGRGGRVLERASSADGIDISVDVERGWVSRGRVYRTKSKSGCVFVPAIGVRGPSGHIRCGSISPNRRFYKRGISMGSDIVTETHFSGGTFTYGLTEKTRA